MATIDLNSAGGFSQAAVILTRSRFGQDGRDELLREFERVNSNDVGNPDALDVVPDDLPQVIAARLQPVDVKTRSSRAEVGHNDSGPVRLNLVDRESELLRQSSVKPGRAVHGERVCGFVNHGTILNGLRFA